MSTLTYIIVFGLLMALIALTGAITLLLKESLLERLLIPLVAFSAGSLMGGALFHMLPSALHHSHELHQELVPYLWLAAGFVSFLILEQLLHWHHCHRTPSKHHKHPLTYLMLVADGVHNFVGGLVVGASFVIDIRLGITTWVVAALHEIPQELGDFGVLVYGGWSKKKALLFNFLSALTFLLGGLIAYSASSKVDVSFLIPFAAGNFIYIAAADLIPEIKTSHSTRRNLMHSLYFMMGLGILLLIKVYLPHAH